MRKVFTVAAGCLFLLFSVMGLAIAHYDTGKYTFRYSGCATQEDPMNITFYQNATAVNVDSHVVDHMGWTDPNGGEAYFSDNAQCLKVPDGSLGIQRTSGLVGTSRDHTRFRQGIYDDSTWGTYSAAAVHHEEVRVCSIMPPINHVATDFDGPRNSVVAAFRNKPGHGTELWAINNNTDVSPQCDGSMPRSIDGKTAWLKVP